MVRTGKNTSGDKPWSSWFRVLGQSARRSGGSPITGQCKYMETIKDEEKQTWFTRTFCRATKEAHWATTNYPTRAKLDWATVAEMVKCPHRAWQRFSSIFCFASLWSSREGAKREGEEGKAVVTKKQSVQAVKTIRSGLNANEKWISARGRVRLKWLQMPF